MAGGPRLFPRRTLENALRVPQVIKQHNAGNPWSTDEVARALNMGRKTGNFYYVTAAARDYGLTEGTRETAQISLTALGPATIPSGSATKRPSPTFAAQLLSTPVPANRNAIG